MMTERTFSPRAARRAEAREEQERKFGVKVFLGPSSRVLAVEVSAR